MEQHEVRVVVGRADPSGADLRALIEDRGFRVVAEASSAEDLARLVQANPPDVVVLDDAIGVAAAQAVQELAPDAKLVVVWPAAVLPIAGAMRVDSAELHTALGPAVAAAAGAFLSGFTTIERPAWVDAVRKDPAALREKLDAAGGVPVRPSVTELQRAHAPRSASTGWRRRSMRPAAAVTAVAAATASGAATRSEEDATVNRRLGIIALGGAVAAGALMIALSFGSNPPSVVTADPFVPGVSAPSNFIPDPAGNGTTGNGPGTTTGGGQTPGGSGPGTTTTGGGTGTTTTSGGTGTGTTSSGTPDIGGSTTGGGSGTDVRTVTHPSASRPGTGGNGGGGAGGGGGGGGNGSHTAGSPGKSGEHNPHGGPPGQTGDHPGNASGHGNANGHAKSQASHRMAHSVHRHTR